MLTNKQADKLYQQSCRTKMFSVKQIFYFKFNFKFDENEIPCNKKN